MPQNFFAEHLGAFVLRKDKCDADFRPYQLPENPKCVTYFHDLQSYGVEFKPLLKVHRGPVEECQSCSA